jgi:predicted aldo/keto reductase-like oxidoreductase
MKISDKQDLEILHKLNSEHIINDIAEVISKGVPYIDAVIDYADRHNLEVEVIGEIIKRSPVLKAKIYREAEELNMVEKLVRLPV